MIRKSGNFPNKLQVFIFWFGERGRRQGVHSWGKISFPVIWVSLWLYKTYDDSRLVLSGIKERISLLHLTDSTDCSFVMGGGRNLFDSPFQQGKQPQRESTCKWTLTITPCLASILFFEANCLNPFLSENVERESYKVQELDIYFCVVTMLHCQHPRHPRLTYLMSQRDFFF